MDKNINLKKDYFYQAARDNEVSLREYFKGIEYNYVIVEDGRVITWENSKCPVIFGDKGDGLNELGQWCGEIRNVSIITEKEMLETYCNDEYKKAIFDLNKQGGIMDSHSHDEELVRKINDAWDKNMEAFYPILCALYRRDIDEITDADSFQIDMWRPDNADGCRTDIINAFYKGKETGDWTRYNELALEDMIREWDFFATNYLEHIADDCDLECILNFLHYPYLPIYK